MLLPSTLLTQLEGRAPGMLVDKVHKDYRTKAQCGTESASGRKEWKMSSTPPFHSSLHNRSLPKERTFYLLGKRKQRKKVNTSSTFLRMSVQAPTYGQSGLKPILFSASAPTWVSALLITQWSSCRFHEAILLYYWWLLACHWSSSLLSSLYV